MVTITVGQWALYIIAHLLYAILAYVIAEYFRKRVLIAFYVYTFLFVGVFPFLFVPDPMYTFVKIKYLIVNIPFILMLLTILAITSGNNCTQTLSKKVFKQELSISKESGDTHGYKTWISWLWWVLFVVNMVVGLREDITDGSIPNAICGVLLCLPFNWPMPLKSLAVTQKPNGEYYTFVNKSETSFEFRLYGVTLLWIIVYTSWDYCLLMGLRGAIWPLFLSVTHLGVPLVRSIVDKRTDLWLFYRAFALGFLLALNTIARQFDFVLVDVIIYDKDADEKKYHLFFIWGLVNCVGAIVNFIIQIVAWKKAKANAAVGQKTEAEIHNSEIIGIMDSDL